MLSCLQSFRSSPVNAGTFHEISHRGRTSTLLFEISVSVCLVEEQLTSYFENKNAVQADFFFFYSISLKKVFVVCFWIIELE